MSRKPRIAVVGSANVDLTTSVIRFRVRAKPCSGRVSIWALAARARNQAVAARLCGADVVMVANVGNDLFGQATVDNFTKIGIDASRVRIVDGVSSGVAPIFVEPNGQNRIMS